MAPNNKAITNKKDLKLYLEKQNTYGYSNVTHEIIDFEVIDDTVIMQGQVIGEFYSSNGGDSVAFRTKNLFVFKQISGKLNIWKVIYNRSPPK